MVQLYPAIDLKDGRIVRLTQGDYNRETIYGQDVLAQAKRWVTAGAQWLHVVDLNAAKSGVPEHAALIQDLARNSGLRIQVGGGIRSRETAEQYLGSGVSRIVIGTQGIRDPDFLSRLTREFPGRIALGLDCREGQIALQGWTELSDLSLKHFFATRELTGLSCLIFTDISRDGMLQGPNWEALQEVLDLSPVPVIASGGVSERADLERLRNLNHPKLQGVIVGKALYAGRLSIVEALAALK